MRSLYLAPVGMRVSVRGHACVCVHVRACVCVYVGIGAYRCAHGRLQVFICHYMQGHVDVDAFVLAVACTCRVMRMRLLGRDGTISWCVALGVHPACSSRVVWASASAHVSGHGDWVLRHGSMYMSGC